LIAKNSIVFSSKKLIAKNNIMFSSKICIFSISKFSFSVLYI
jgi:hypothetical protein